MIFIAVRETHSAKTPETHDQTQREREIVRSERERENDPDTAPIGVDRDRAIGDLDLADRDRDRDLTDRDLAFVCPDLMIFFLGFVCVLRNEYVFVW